MRAAAADGNISPSSGRYRRISLEPEQHSRVSQCVGFHTIEVEELGDAVIVRTEQLDIHLGRHRRAADFGETMTGEERHGEGQHKYPRYAHLPGAVK